MSWIYGLQDNVVVDYGDVVTLQGWCQCASLTINPGGVVIWDPDISTQLECTGNVINMGTRIMRPSDPNITHRLTFADIDETQYVGGGMTVLSSDVGLWVMNAGQEVIKGWARERWNRTGAHCSWIAGDELIIAPHEPGDTRTGPFPTFLPLDFEPYDGQPVPGNDFFDGKSNVHIKTEVINLTSNVVIEGYPGARAHVTIMSSKPQRFSDVKFDNLGPRGVLGRYPLHWHHCKNGSRGSYARRVIITNSGNRAVVTHDSNGITIDRSAAYKIENDAFWYDKPTSSETNQSHGIVWTNNFVGLCTLADPQSTYRLSAFQLGAGTDLWCVGNVAAAIQGSYQASGYHWPEYGHAPNSWAFIDCLSHNNRGSGAFMWRNDAVKHVWERFTAYHCNAFGAFAGAYLNVVEYNGLRLFANGRAFNWASQQWPKGQSGILDTEGRRHIMRDTVLDGLNVEGKTDASLVCKLHASQTVIDRPATLINCVFTRCGDTNPCVRDNSLGHKLGRWNFVGNVRVLDDGTTRDLVASDFSILHPHQSFGRIAWERRDGFAFEFNPSGGVDALPRYALSSDL